MTRVDFFFNVENKSKKLAELAEKITAKGHQLYIYAPEKQIAQALDDYLWAFTASSFLPHAMDTIEPSAILIESEAKNLLHDDVMVNFALEVPTFFSRFLRVIEIVSTDEADKVAARKRFKLYRDQGYDIKTLDATDQ